MFFASTVFLFFAGDCKPSSQHINAGYLLVIFMIYPTLDWGIVMSESQIRGNMELDVYDQTVIWVTSKQAQKITINYKRGSNCTFLGVLVWALRFLFLALQSLSSDSTSSSCPSAGKSLSSSFSLDSQRKSVD